MRKEIKVGIIDDDAGKVTQIITQLKYGMDEVIREKQKKYNDIKFAPIEIPLTANPEDVNLFISSKKIDVVLMDYNLTSYANVSYTGVHLAKVIENKFMNYPIFILTAYEDELFEQEIYNAYQVFDFARYLSDKDERIELNCKIIEQVLKHDKEVESWKQELIELLPEAGQSEVIDTRILLLDDMIEKTIDGERAIPTRVKEELSGDKVDKLLNSIDKLLIEE